VDMSEMDTTGYTPAGAQQQNFQTCPVPGLRT
jgi:hypothetical protein